MSAAVAEIADNRSGIEHGKAMLMLVYGVDVGGAFDLLRWRSQETNVKLRVLAERIVREFAALSKGESWPPRSVFDRVLSTAHLRVGDTEAGAAEAVS